MERLTNPSLASDESNLASEFLVAASDRIETRRVGEISWMYQQGYINTEEKQRRIENGWGWNLFALRFRPVAGTDHISVPPLNHHGWQRRISLDTCHYDDHKTSFDIGLAHAGSTVHPKKS